MNSKKVSIIMPAYNAEKYLPRSIGSVVAQTYTDWELLIVDDGSTDGSRDICRQWSEKDSRIKLICNSHGGTALARNTALDVAEGEYIAFLDADDAYHRQYLESMLKPIFEHGCDLSVCATVRGNDADRYLKGFFEPSFEICSKEQIFDYMYNGKWPDMIAPYTKVYSRCLFDKVRFPSGKFFEDAATMNLTVYYSNRISISECPLYFYNITPNSSSVTKRSVELLDREWALRSHWEFYFREGRNDLAYLALPFYLAELISIYHRIENSDKPQDCGIIRDRFEKTYKKYKRYININDERKDAILAFRYPHLYDVRKMIRKDGVFGALEKFIKRKIKK